MLPVHRNLTVHQEQAFQDKHAQSHLKPARILVVKTWMILVPFCRVEEGCQKLYMAKFKCEDVHSTQRKGNRKAAAIFEVDESGI
jgi:hypothetical protein